MFSCLLFIVICYMFFFFKQKTAYEMRISDWSSDVCSSDLVDGILAFGEARLDDFLGLGRCAREGIFDRRERQAMLGLEMMKECALADACLLGDRGRPQPRKAARCDHFERCMRNALAHRSDEHTSELQSLMRISYAVFCLKKKKQHDKK